MSELDTAAFRATISLATGCSLYTISRVLDKFSLPEIASMNDYTARRLGISKRFHSFARALHMARKEERLEELREMPGQMVAPELLYEYLRLHVGFEDVEEAGVIFCRNDNSVITVENLFRGGLNSTVIDKRVVLRRALELRSPNIVVYHNHPSGQTEPGAQDRRMARELKDAGRTLDITMNDFLIVGRDGFYSWAEAGCP